MNNTITGKKYCKRIMLRITEARGMDKLSWRIRMVQYFLKGRTRKGKRIEGAASETFKTILRNTSTFKSYRIQKEQSHWGKF